MSAPASTTQWYLARDSQQYGPLTEAELARFIELGHLQPTDLLWREGFPDWRPAMVVFPQRRPAPTRPAPGRPANIATPRQPAPAATARERTMPPGARLAQDSRPGPLTVDPIVRGRPGQTRKDAEEEEPGDERPRGGRLRRVLLTLCLLGLLGGAGWYGYQYQAMIKTMLTQLSARIPAVLLESGDRKSMDAPPLKGLGGPAEAIDASLQTAALWRVVKREFPEWYAEQLKAAAALAAQNQDGNAVAQHMTRALVGLRRQNVNHALSAELPRLKAVASSFFENLVQLRKHSTEACFEFISRGEASPVVVALLQNSTHTVHLQAQLTAVFEAIADGRKTPRAYPQPRKSDYDTLAAELTKMGWSQGDMQLFSDERALAQAPPEKVCQLVHDWFAAQLGLKDRDMQLRLMVDSLKPVIAG